MSSFVESLRRLYEKDLVQKDVIKKQLQDGRISHAEYLYITQGEEA